LPEQPSWATGTKVGSHVQRGNNGGTAHPKSVIFSGVDVGVESVAEALDEPVCLLEFAFCHEIWLEKKTTRPSYQHEHLEIFLGNPVFLVAIPLIRRIY